MNWNYEDLLWEIRNFESQGFKFFIKYLLFNDPWGKAKNELIYGEIQAIKDKKSKNYIGEYIEYRYIKYNSRIIKVSDLKDFVKDCHLYKRVQYMKMKEKKDDETIINELKINDSEYIQLLDYPYSNWEYTENISLQNLNYTSDFKFFDSDPLDYKINKDSSTVYYQLDFSVQATDLREYDELFHSGLDFYPTLNDFIYHKFGKDFSTNNKLKNSFLFIFPKEHIGRVKINIIGNKLSAKLTHLTSKELQLKLQVKRSDTLELQHLEFNFDEKNLEKEVVLDFVPDMLDGYLLDYYDEHPDYQIQKISRRYDITETSLTNEKALKKIIHDGEGLKTDFKLMFPHKENDITKLKDQKIIKEICSFANTDGGVIIFGVNDDAKIKGYDVKKQFKSVGDFEQYIQGLGNNKIEPPVTIKVYKSRVDNKPLQIVQIFPSDSWVRIKSSKEYIVRKGSTARRTYPGEIKKYTSDKYSR